jgi:hypothetical protein
MFILLGCTVSHQLLANLHFLEDVPCFFLYQLDLSRIMSVMIISDTIWPYTCETRNQVV